MSSLLLSNESRQTQGRATTGTEAHVQGQTTASHTLGGLEDLFSESLFPSHAVDAPVAAAGPHGGATLAGLVIVPALHAAPEGHPSPSSEAMPQSGWSPVDAVTRVTGREGARLTAIVTRVRAVIGA